MHRTIFGQQSQSRLGLVAALAVVALLIAGCGPIGDKNNDPTATTETIAQPTDAPVTVEPSATTAAETPADNTPDMISPPTEAGTLSTPVPSTEVLPTGPFSTPVGEATTASTEEPGTPVVTESVATESVATPQTEVALPTEEAESSFAGSDGTSGATPDPNATAEPESTTAPEAAASPGAFFVREETTPDVSQPPTDGNLAKAKPLSVDSCKPAVITPMPDAPVAYTTLFELNFRSGPGADCSKVTEDPIPDGTDLQVLSWPVVRDGEEGNIWIQVQVGNQKGWVVIDGLEVTAP